MSMTSSPPSDGTAGKATLLFVDDERRVLTSMRAMFRRDYHVFVANSGQEALELLDRESVDVVISDQRMPEMTGVELLCAIKERAPEVMRILLTGYADLEAIEASINEGEVFRYLMKPCPPDDLKKAIAMAVDASRSDQSEIEEIELQPVGQPPAELIPFPKAKKPPKSAASAPSPATEAKPGSAPEATTSRPASDARRAPQVDVLVLSADRDLQTIIAEVAEQTVHNAGSVEEALEVLSKKPVGVMVTDLSTDGDDVETLTKTLKAEVPELITIVASDRSDANTLISLINEGQIYRFLLKPVSRGQCRLWLQSAVRKYTELASSDEAASRYRVEASTASTQEGFIDRALSGLKKLRARLRGQSSDV